MKRSIILMMDSFGIGGAEDAGRFGDQGADTLGTLPAGSGKNGPRTVRPAAGPAQSRPGTGWNGPMK